jgi:hypothetical protein
MYESRNFHFTSRNAGDMHKWLSQLVLHNTRLSRKDQQLDHDRLLRRKDTIVGHIGHARFPLLHISAP